SAAARGPGIAPPHRLRGARAAHRLRHGLRHGWAGARHDDGAHVRRERRSRPDGDPAPRAGMSSAAAPLVHLRGGGVSVVVDASGPGLPRLLHWGKALADDGDLLATDPPQGPHASLDSPRAFTLLPTQHEGWAG